MGRWGVPVRSQRLFAWERKQALALQYNHHLLSSNALHVLTVLHQKKNIFFILRKKNPKPQLNIHWQYDLHSSYLLCTSPCLQDTSGICLPSQKGLADAISPSLPSKRHRGPGRAAHQQTRSLTRMRAHLQLLRWAAAGLVGLHGQELIWIPGC